MKIVSQLALDEQIPVVSGDLLRAYARTALIRLTVLELPHRIFSKSESVPRFSAHWADKE